MLRTVNHRRAAKGRRPLKTVSTVLARGKPKRITSIQAKRHLGQSFFCCKKPPKTEDSETELTHHQRAHVKNAVENFCHDDEDRKYALIKSMDDTACVRPGTLVGLRDVKRGGIYQCTDSDKARKLPVFRTDRPDLYEVSDSGSSFSIPFRRFCTRVRDKVKNFTENNSERCNGS